MKIRDAILDKITGEWGKEPIGNDGIKVLRTTNFTNEGCINYDNVVIREIPVSLVDKKKLISGDVVIEKSGGSPNQPVGRVVYFDNVSDTFLCNNFTSVLRPKKNVFPKYFFYCLFYKHLSKKTLKYQNKTTGIINLQLEKYLDEDIHVPPIDDQKKIVQKLDLADDIRRKRKEQLALLDDYLKSVFLDMFGDPETNDKGWEIKEFDYFASIDTNMTTDFEKYAEYPHIGISNIEKDTGILFNYKLIKEENLISGKYIFTPEHIIYSKIRPNLNKVALPDFHGLSSADSYPILVRKGHANKIFFTFLLRSSFFIDFILKHSMRTNIPKANKEQIRAFRGIAPPIDLQNKFSQIYEQVEQTKQKMRASLDEMDNHFNALMQRYFG